MTARRLTPFSIALAYLGFAVVALVSTDLLLAAAVRSPERFMELQAVKGVGEIGVTAVFIYLLTHHGQQSLRQANDHLSRQQRAMAVLQRVLRHNVRNHMTVITGRAESLYDAEADERTEIAEIGRAHV